MSRPDATSDLVTLVARAAHDRGGINPVLVDVTSKLALADAFVVVSAPTDRQVRAISEDIMDRVWAERGRRPDHIEGRAEGTWVLLDYSELLVHVLCEDEREYYALERLWGDCPAVPIDVDTDQARAAACRSDQSLIAVSHGSAIARGIVSLLGLDPAVFNGLRGVDNCHWSELVPVGISTAKSAARTGWRLASHNIGAREDVLGA